MRGLPPNRRPLHSPRHLLLAAVEGPTRHIPGSASHSDLPEAPPEWVYTGLYTFFLQYYRSSTYYSISCLGLLLTRDLFRSCPGLLDVVEQGGDSEAGGDLKPPVRLQPQEPATRVSLPYSTSHSAGIQLHRAGSSCKLGPVAQGLARGAYE